ncbi:SGNH/GDSL hydrolase family protein [Streptomyces halobius]|uniref:SGNH/GDSL hydrolase family protein n=2 Tax=Streptomyces halobius TaxID=2879846 RepID=A0ABY4MHS5_9ACTN|nr:SGNH/GDSL hydrolase family protein [Streptomyces halobius]UQA96797.1 SGNH/GDSL hydrolase family protein [Streptomyces halobius]
MGTEAEGQASPSSESPARARRSPEPPAPEPPAPAPSAPPRFVALGDSLTEGLGDPLPGGGWRGWAALLAEAVGERPGSVRLVNLAASGALAADVAERQLPVARRFAPRLASLVVGANDTLRAGFDIAKVAAALDLAHGTLSADGAVVLTACLPDPGRMLGLPAPLARPLARRMRAVNTVVHAVTARYGGVHLHIADHRWIADRGCWSVDRLHPSERGHRLLAHGFHAALAAAGRPVGPPPALTPDGPPPNRAASAWWMATRGTRWVADRCTDLLPGLLALAWQECRHGLAGSGRLLDTAAERATRTALAALGHVRHESPVQGLSDPKGAATMAG